ncbi:MAG: hypothetical protein VXV91_04230, partial [Verrucomicrobiota bacterium]|nr:hypothetical protein [Verrucomicrobiota bacterium]
CQTKATLTRVLDVELQSNGVGQHRRFTVLENISHQIKDVFVEPSLVLKLCDGNPQWDGISKEIALQKGPFKDFVLSHVSTRRINLSGMKMVASLQPRARYTGEQAFKELMPNLAEYPVSVIEDVMKLYRFIIKMHLEATRSGIQLADAGLHNFAFFGTFSHDGGERRLQPGFYFLWLDWENCKQVTTPSRSKGINDAVRKAIGSIGGVLALGTETGCKLSQVLRTVALSLWMEVPDHEISSGASGDKWFDNYISIVNEKLLEEVLADIDAVRRRMPPVPISVPSSRQPPAPSVPSIDFLSIHQSRKCPASASSTISATVTPKSIPRRVAFDLLQKAGPVPERRAAQSPKAGPAPERRAAQSPKAGPAVKAQNTMVHAPAKEWKTDASRMQHTTQQLLLSRCKSPLSSPQSSQRETLAAPVAAVQKLQSINAQSNRRGYKNSADDERGSKESVGKSGGKRFKGNRGKTMESERKRNREESGRDSEKIVGKFRGKRFKGEDRLPQWAADLVAAFLVALLTAIKPYALIRCKNAPHTEPPELPRTVRF